jgi:uncharacterized protein YgfB (UPF0149 family)
MDVPSHSTLPEYAAMAVTLQRSGLVQSPAETQGFALGLLVADVAEPLQIWQQELYSEFDPADVLATECRVLLDRIFADVFAADHAQPMQLSLLLPQDIVVDSARLAAVRDWCQGFLFGFGLGGEVVARALSEPSRELLRDITEMTRLDTQAVENTPDNQSALIEIEEYLRVGVMLIREDLAGEREAHEPE